MRERLLRRRVILSFSADRNPLLGVGGERGETFTALQVRPAERTAQKNALRFPREGFEDNYPPPEKILRAQLFDP